MSIEAYSYRSEAFRLSSKTSRSQSVPQTVEASSFSRAVALPETPATPASAPKIRLTSENRRRHEVLKTAGLDAVSVRPPNEEPQIRETYTIAQTKIADSLPTVSDVKPGDFFIGSDALIFIGDKHASKPRSQKDLRENLKRMAEHGGYDVRSHTVVAQYPLDNQPDSNELSFSTFPLGTRVRLNPEKASFLASRKGARTYKKAFREFYDGKITYEKVASGVCILVLVAMGMVDELDGVKLDANDPQTSLEALYGSTFTAIMNVAPQALMYIRQSSGNVPGNEIFDELERIPEAQRLAEKAFQRFQQKSALR